MDLVHVILSTALVNYPRLKLVGFLLPRPLRLASRNIPIGARAFGADLRFLWGVGIPFCSTSETFHSADCVIFHFSHHTFLMRKFPCGWVCIRVSRALFAGRDGLPASPARLSSSHFFSPNLSYWQRFSRAAEVGCLILFRWLICLVLFATLGVYLRAPPSLRDARAYYWGTNT